MQNNVLVDDDDISENHEEDVDGITEEVTEDNDNYSIDEESEQKDEDNDGSNEDVVAVENRAVEWWQLKKPRLNL